ncbi:MAG: hypothetical protein MMC23_001740 [Stictis urceolatum]|nr:hypothetical protein [Stictis urceolata]
MPKDIVHMVAKRINPREMLAVSVISTRAAFKYFYKNIKSNRRDIETSRKWTLATLKSEVRHSEEQRFRLRLFSEDPAAAELLCTLCGIKHARNHFSPTSVAGPVIERRCKQSYASLGFLQMYSVTPNEVIEKIKGIEGHWSFQHDEASRILEGFDHVKERVEAYPRNYRHDRAFREPCDSYRDLKNQVLALPDESRFAITHEMAKGSRTIKRFSPVKNGHHGD